MDGSLGSIENLLKHRDELVARVGELEVYCIYCIKFVFRGDFLTVFVFRRSVTSVLVCSLFLHQVKSKTWWIKSLP